MAKYGDHMHYSKLITIEPDKRSGQPCIRGLRMTAQDVLDLIEKIQERALTERDIQLQTEVEIIGN